jgi:hypothetical protein
MAYRFCSGQSNMELPMAHALTRNRTYAALDLHGMYSNIRTFQQAAHIATFDGNEQFITAPPVPPPAPKDGSAPKSYNGWQKPNSSKIEPFSAACWFFGQELTDISIDKNETPPILGLVESAWGTCIGDHMQVHGVRV